MDDAGWVQQADGSRTYYETHGEGPPLLLLHGGLCPIETFGPQRVLGERFQLWLPERRGHGRTPDIEGAYSYQQMLEDTLGFMDAVELANADVVGFSDGANLGLLLAIQAPQQVRRLVSVSGNFDPSGNLEPEEVPPRGSIERSFQGLVDMYGQLSPDGADHFSVVFDKLQQLWGSEPQLSTEQLGSISAPTLVMAADADLISLEHTIEMYRRIPEARLCVVPDAGHDLMVTRPDLVNPVILDFLLSSGNGDGEHPDAASARAGVTADST